MGERGSGGPEHASSHRTIGVLSLVALFLSTFLAAAGPALAQEEPEELWVEITWASPMLIWIGESSEGFSCEGPPLDHTLPDPPTASVVCQTEVPVRCQSAAVSLEAETSTTGYRGTGICGHGPATTWAECSTEAGLPGMGLVFAPAKKTCQAESPGDAVTSGFICLITPLEPRSDPGLVTQRCSWTVVA